MRNTPRLFGMSRYQPCVQLYLPRQTIPACRNCVGRIHAITVKSPLPTSIELSRGTTTASPLPSSATALPFAPIGDSTNFASPTNRPSSFFGFGKLSAVSSNVHAPTSFSSSREASACTDSPADACTYTSA